MAGRVVAGRVVAGRASAGHRPPGVAFVTGVPDPGLGPTSFEAPAAVAETHISVVWFVGDRAYKLKKPVRLGFLDFSTLEARAAACAREVELNRRLAPASYLGVVDLCGPDGAVVDHLVAMRRLPPSARLEQLVRSGDPAVGDHLDHIARLLADFHSRAAAGPEIDAAATPEAMRANWDESFADLEPFTGPVLDPGTSARVAERVHRYLAGRGPLLATRRAGGHVVDGHGDLQAADIFCLPEGPQILDCIEFNDRFRYGDVVLDVGFLAMDLERLGASDHAAALIAAYDTYSGEVAPASLWHHAIAYRAHVRAKVACLRSAQLDGSARAEAEADARSLLELTDRHLADGRVRLVLVGGPPGTGKSRLARGIADAEGWTALRSDVVRKELAGLPTTTAAGAEWEAGLYEPGMTGRTYDELLRRAGIALGLGETVVLDASWSSPEHRAAARRLAADHVADLDEVLCVVPLGEALARVERRRRRGADASDADADVTRRAVASFAPWPEASVVDTAGPKAASLATGRAVLGLDPGPGPVTAP